MRDILNTKMYAVTIMIAVAESVCPDGNDGGTSYGGIASTRGRRSRPESAGQPHKGGV
ncbi:hypothetical protein GCM10009585_19570 [Brevibacterium paucivorans]